MRYFGIAIVTILLLSCAENEHVKIFEPYDGPIAEAHDVTSLFSDSAIVRIKMESPLQYELQNNDKEFPKGISMEFYNLSGKVQTTLTANYAKYISETGIYNVKGNVEIANLEEGEKLNSEALYWNPATERIYTDTTNQVRIQTPTELLVGYGLTAKQDFSTYKILNPTGIFEVSN